MPVTGIELLTVAFCYLLLLILPLAMIKIVLNKKSGGSNTSQIMSAFILYPVFFLSWYYFTEILTDTYEKSIVYLYVSVFISAILIFVILLLIKKNNVFKE